MIKIAKGLRLFALSLLSGGSTAIVFAAVVLVHAAKAHGVPVPEAAANNAPAFIQYSKVALGAAILLGIAEIIILQLAADKNKVGFFRLGASLLCILSVAAFAFGIVPSMERLLPDIKTITEAHEQFQRLHEISRGVFGASILMAYISLLLPVFKHDSVTTPAKVEEKVLL